MQLAMKSISHYFISMVLVLVCTTAGAEWKKIANGNLQEPEQYIEMDSVMQTGPMAIYRQVNVLSQGGALLPKDISSKLSLYEYDCMNSKFRVLQTSAYSETWAAGDKVVLQSPTQKSKDWQDLPPQSLGQISLSMLCPGTEQTDASK
jgi:hypothetical protein